MSNTVTARTSALECDSFWLCGHAATAIPNKGLRYQPRSHLSILETLAVTQLVRDFLMGLSSSLPRSQKPVTVPDLESCKCISILTPYLLTTRNSRDSSVGIATDWTTAVRFQEGVRYFLFSIESRPTPALIQPLVQCVTERLFNGD
jgi:hypothetical protein